MTRYTETEVMYKFSRDTSINKSLLWYSCPEHAARIAMDIIFPDSPPPPPQTNFRTIDSMSILFTVGRIYSYKLSRMSLLIQSQIATLFRQNEEPDSVLCSVRTVNTVTDES
jgi:hypothetical protein